MNYFITGGAGFIGSHLARKLLRDGNTVQVLDNLSTGSLKNNDDIKNHKRFSFKKGTIMNRALVHKMARGADQIFHLAAAVGVKVVMRKPLESFVNNTDGTKNVLDAACSFKIPVLTASTSEVYGKSQDLPYKEEADKLYGSFYNARWGYALSKAVDEFLTICYVREKGLKAVIARFFNTAGPGQSNQYGMVIPTFMKCALNGAPIPVHGDGNQVRCFTHVDDVVQAIIKLLATPKAHGEIFNVGSMDAITVNVLAEKIKKITDSPSKITHISKDVMMKETGDEMKVRIPDNSKIFRTIGWRPTMNIDEILASTLALMTGQKS